MSEGGRTLGRSVSLVVGAGGQSCAIPIAYVDETMRPLPIAPIVGAPQYLLGLSVIRGASVPVVDLPTLIGSSRGETMSRFVALRLDGRRAALAVGAVMGLRELERSDLEAMPPLLRGAHADVIEAVGVLDACFLFVLRAARLLPEGVWQELAARGKPS
jgi:purine-binding chemotaxis protein CheW